MSNSFLVVKFDDNYDQFLISTSTYYLESWNTLTFSYRELEKVVSSNSLQSQLNKPETKLRTPNRVKVVEVRHSNCFKSPTIYLNPFE
ncbi:hypothetical protein QE152_g7225 [Popillia japonica]|uniref:Uncharacterized protein n=1 Tax=Popillia japonica TaxID=7064 RepID=A0AAW1ME13_POPJA